MACQVYCPNCGSSFLIELAYWSDQSCFCKHTCRTEFLSKYANIKKVNNATNEAKKESKLCLRIAELEHIEDLDSLVEDLRQLPDLSVDRYKVPAYIFAGYAPGESLEFPIATLDSGQSRIFREYGLVKVTAACKKLLGDSMPTRKISRPDWASIFGVQKISP